MTHWHRGADCRSTGAFLLGAVCGALLAGGEGGAVKDVQYNRPVADGLTRYWVSWTTQVEDWPSGAPWRWWVSGWGADDEAVICALIDAPDEGAVWKAARDVFPDAEERFCDVSNETTLVSLATGGRFT